MVDQLSKEAVKWSGRPIKYVGCISEVVDQFTKYNIYAMWLMVIVRGYRRGYKKL